jgi:hypothetical protein
MSSLLTIRDDVDQWFSGYFKAFIDICAGRSHPDAILLDWSVPLHTSGPKHSKWLKSAEEVVGVLNDMQGTLKELGYTHTEAIDKEITVYSDNAARVETIMSRRRSDGAEVDRAAIAFDLRCAGDEWIITSTTARPTKETKLREVW